MTAFEPAGGDAVPSGADVPLTAIVIHRGQPQALQRTVRALRTDDASLRVVIVDNASSAEDRALLATIEGAEVIALEQNAGFGPAANVALRAWLADGEGDWCLLLPHDAVAEPGCVERLVSAVAERPKAGMASAEYADGQYGSNAKVKPAIHPYLGTYLVPARAEPGWEDADHPHGTLMILNRQCLGDIGLFDERYFAYSEEADLALRASRAGWGVGIVWGAVVRNTGMTSEVGVPEYLMQRNTLLLVKEHFGRRAAAMMFVITLYTCALGTLVPSKRPLFWHRTARWLALSDFVRGRVGPPNPRLVS